MSTSYYETCSIQIKLPDEWIEKLQIWSKEVIDESLLYYHPSEPGYGRDDRNHITITIGLDESNLEALETIVGAHIGILEIEATKIKCFDNDQYDVIYLEIAPSSELVQMNEQAKLLVKQRTKSRRNKFIPHCTIAFVQKGTGKKLIDKLSWEQKSFVPFRWVMTEVEMINRDNQSLPLCTSTCK